MPIKLIAADMDDTLLTSEGQISQRTLEALGAAKARGALIVLASGRMVESMLHAARQVQVNAPLLAYNGGVTYDVHAGRILRQTAVDPDCARELCRLAEQLGVHIQGYSEGGYYFERDNEYSQRYAQGIHLAGRPVHKKLSEYIDCDQFKLLMIGERQRIAEVLPLFQERFCGRVKCANSKPIYIECIAPGIDKGAALKALAEDMGIARDEILAFGDGQNDLEMLHYAGLGYAVGNASELVRGSAPHVAPSNDEDGPAQIVERLLRDDQIMPWRDA